MPFRSRGPSRLPRAVLALVAATVSACSGSPASIDDRGDQTTVPPAPEGDRITPSPSDDGGSPAPVVDPSALPAITAGHGISVDAVIRVSDRTFDVTLSTPSISAAKATAKGNGVRITLPPGYATSGKSYPVLYFLHGADGGYQSLFAVMDVETKVSGPTADVIVVMPEGGRGGFYTDWVDQSIAQKWETYHLTELVPFIDQNLRTVAAKEGRGIIGISMGGLGAMRYAVDRPDLFAAATTLSGAVDLASAGVQLAVTATNAKYGLNATGAYGALGISPLWGQVSPANPSRAARLATVQTFIYAGGGNDPGEVITTAASNNLHDVLVAANIEHFFRNYGVPGDTPQGNCNGGHTWPCFNYAFVDALPRMIAKLASAR